MAADYRRLVIVGGPGSGKTTLARAIARRLDLPHTELDGLWWGRDWTPDPGFFKARVAQLAGGPEWVLDGNYFEQIARLTWPRADAVVWLDLPRARCVARAVWRSALRVLTRRDLWNGNRERLTVLSPSSVLRVYRRWPEYSATTARLVGELSLSAVVRLRTDTEAEAWFSSLPGRALPGLKASGGHDHN